MAPRLPHQAPKAWRRVSAARVRRRKKCRRNLPRGEGREAARSQKAELIWRETCRGTAWAATPERCPLAGQRWQRGRALQTVCRNIAGGIAAGHSGRFGVRRVAMFGLFAINRPDCRPCK
eukprot:scaffold12711_cov120-Isochrysis_galbana.AAC.7